MIDRVAHLVRNHQAPTTYDGRDLGFGPQPMMGLSDRSFGACATMKRHFSGCTRRAFDCSSGRTHIMRLCQNVLLFPPHMGRGFWHRPPFLWSYTAWFLKLRQFSRSYAACSMKLSLFISFPAYIERAFSETFFCTQS